MAVSKDRFIKKYVKAIYEGNAAVFAGAGLSRASGYTNWKELLKPLANEIGLDVNKETDLLAVAQYCRNERGSRISINKEILSAFTADAGENDNVDIITRLPIHTYWTTNYDRLIEKGLEVANRKSDVKIESEQLVNTVPGRDAVVYKMHGDAGSPAHAVLTKDDYVLYDKERPLFKTVLKGDLLSKQFLFIGFSFEDPNLDYVLNQIHALVGENVQEHFCFFRRVQRADYGSDEEYGYEKAKQDMRTYDLGRYGIETIYVDDFAEITEILHNIEFAVKRNKVFISGSADDYGKWEKEKAEALAKGIAEILVKNDYQVTSGFGLGIGSAVVNGALEEIYRSKYKHVSDYLCLHPFPQNITDPSERQRIFRKYREDMINGTGIAVFLFGNKKDPSDAAKIIDANGCWEEFEIAREKGNLIIPIASTGFIAEKIMKELKLHPDEFAYLNDYIPILETETDVVKLKKVILEIANRCNCL